MIKYNLSGTWKLIKYAYTNISGSWKTIGQIYININGTWKHMWSYQWNVSTWSNCSASCGGGTQTRTVTCLRNDGQTVSDSLCTKYVGSKPATSQSCNTQSCAPDDCRYSTVSPKYGVFSSNGVIKNVSEFFWNGQQIYKPNPFEDQDQCVVDGYLYIRGDLMEQSTTLKTKYYKICRGPV